MVRKLKPQRQAFKRKQRIGPRHVPPEAGAQGEAVAHAAATILNHIMTTAPFEIALAALVIMWRNEEGKLMCIPTVAGFDQSCIPAAAAALRGIGDSLDEGDYSVTSPEPPPGTVVGKA
jgi:hypothetical protein